MNAPGVLVKAITLALIEIRSQQHLRQLQQLSFCYLCGNELGEDRTSEHVVAASLIMPADRTPPLILPAHKTCNAGFSVDDGRMAELMGHLHGNSPNSTRTQLKYFLEASPVQDPMGAVTGVAMERVIIRWIRGFHAALYRQFLPEPTDTTFCISHPFSRGRAAADGGVVLEPIQDVHTPICRAIQANRLSKRIDRIEIYNGKCVYECTWDSVTDSRGKHDACIFALNLYDWKELGSTPRTITRGCVGLYRAQGQRPSNAAIATAVDTSMLRLDEFNPFAGSS